MVSVRSRYKDWCDFIRDPQRENSEFIGEKANVADEIKKQTEEFLAKGGVIQQIEPGVSADPEISVWDKNSEYRRKTNQS